MEAFNRNLFIEEIGKSAAKVMNTKFDNILRGLGYDEAKISDYWHRTVDSNDDIPFENLKEQLTHDFLCLFYGKGVESYILMAEKDFTQIGKDIWREVEKYMCEAIEGRQILSDEINEIVKYLICVMQRRTLDLEDLITRLIEEESKYQNDCIKIENEWHSMSIMSKIAQKRQKENGYKNLLTEFFTIKTHRLIAESIKRLVQEVCHENRHLCEGFASVFAPAEIKCNSHMLVQVYLHLIDESEKVSDLAQESDKNAERRDYIPLQCKLKKGDKVDVLLNIYGETLMMSDKKSVVWQGSFTKCSFDYFVPKDINVDELSCVALLSVNGVPVGDIRFITKIVDSPRQLNPEIIAHKYNKVFISYSHQDESKVKFLHEGLAMGGVSHFFDRSYLKPGDIFPKVIQDYINTADLFVLCWSENAAQSEYVKKERIQALERAYPKEQDGKLSIYPMSIEPRAELPSDMKDNYHFGEI